MLASVTGNSACGGPGRIEVGLHNNDNDSNNSDCTESCNSRFFYNLIALRTVSNPYAQVAKVQSGATHWALITCHATWYEGTAQLLSLTQLKVHLF